MADREGFEPSVTLLPHTLSKRAHSTTLTPALGGRDARDSAGAWQSLFTIFKKSFAGDAGEDPQEVGKAVEKEPDDFGHGLAGFVEGKHAALGAAGDGARIIETCAGERTFGTGAGPTGEADALGFVAVGLGDDPVEIGGGEGGVVFFDVAGFVFGQVGELAHESDEAGLEGVDQRDPLVIAGGGAGEPERSIEFVDVAEGFDAEGGFGDAFAKEEVGFARIAAASDDAHGGKVTPQKNQCPSAFIRGL